MNKLDKIDNESDLIKEHFRQEIDKQKDNIIFYINECMTQEERNKHGDNLWNMIIHADSSFALLELKLMSLSFNKQNEK